ncbi:MAG TPA: hypothetical protein PK114_01990, partial [Smithellaceae bacterium]|nr:hypothetical protein [Smithellaceae bacterium]
EEDLPIEIRNGHAVPADKDLADLPLREQVKLLEARIIAEAVEKYGNARRAALHLKVNPSIISRRQKRITGRANILLKSNIVAKKQNNS